MWTGGTVPLYLTSVLGAGERLASRPGRFTAQERAPGTDWIGGWVGPKGSLEAMKRTENLFPLPEIEPRPSRHQLYERNEANMH
jgi:hypothetical protein